MINTPPNDIVLCNDLVDTGSIHVIVLSYIVKKTNKTIDILIPFKHEKINRPTRCSVDCDDVSHIAYC